MNRQILQKNPDLKVFGPLALMGERGLSDQELKNCEGVILISSGHWFTPEGKLFCLEFMKIYGYRPGPVAAYAYDGTNLIIEAIKSAGTDSEHIRKSLAEIKHSGASGIIQFDEKGNRVWTGELVKVRNGKISRLAD